jgi:hypothetical protein
MIPECSLELPLKRYFCDLLTSCLRSSTENVFLDPGLRHAKSEVSYVPKVVDLFEGCSKDALSLSACSLLR